MKLWNEITRTTRCVVSFDRTQRQALCRAVLLVPLITLLLRLWGFEKTCSLLRSRLLSSLLRVRVRPDDEQSILAVAQSVNRAARYGGLARVSCLQKSMVLWSLLYNSGIESSIEIGVRSAAGKMEAHAWVTSRGAVINERCDVATAFRPIHAA